MKTKYIIYSLLLFFLVSCDSEDFLTKYPKDQLVEATTFTTNANFQTYAWKLYETFPGYHRSERNTYLQEMQSDLMVNNSGTKGHDIFWQNKTVPASSSIYTKGYAKIRNIHLMLDNIEGSKLTDNEKLHWEGVGKFFRAYEYFFLLKTFGPTPLISKGITDQDTTELYKARATRDEMADFILKDLKDAEQKINQNGNGPNTINTNVVRALLSRFGLFEGTWRKYHNLGGGTKFLQASKEASEALMTTFPLLHPDYDAVFNSESLKGVDGIILYKAYEFAVLTGNYAHYNRSSIGSEDITKKGADMFLCLDGQTIFTSPLFDGEKDPYNEFRSRDRRMYVNIVPPFRVNTGGKNQLTWKYDSDEKNREYIDLMEQLYPNQNQKRLPTMNWRGLIVRVSPHFRKFNEGHGFNVTYSGYAFHKYYNTYSKLQSQDWTDTPIFRMGEVLLNYAEVMKELGLFNQAVADATINKLRDRGAVAHLDLNNIPNDPTRDSDVDPVMWEIRRERFVEYFGEGFGRALDIKRWGKLVEYGAKEKIGRWIKKSDYKGRVPIVGGGDEGYVKIFGTPPGVPEYYYLEPIPSNEIVLNPKLKQNPSWDNN
jgi:hypothetical protein